MKTNKELLQDLGFEIQGIKSRLARLEGFNKDAIDIAEAIEAMQKLMLNDLISLTFAEAIATEIKRLQEC